MKTRLQTVISRDEPIALAKDGGGFRSRSRLFAGLGLFLWLLVATGGPSWADSVRVLTDRSSYNAGSVVNVKFVKVMTGGTESASGSPRALAVVIRYAGDSRPIIQAIPVPETLPLSPNYRPLYHHIWKIPMDAKTGRYEIVLEEQNPKSHEVLSTLASGDFTVYTKRVRIEEIKLDKTFYTSGDPVSGAVLVENLTDKPLTGLRVEFSNRYWPWIAGPAEAAKASVVTLAESLNLGPRGTSRLRADHVETVENVKQPATHQYGVVVWDHARKTVLDIAFSQLVFVDPPGVDSSAPYPGQYVYPTLNSVNTTAYRHFYTPELDSPAIQFDHDHTMYPSSGEAQVSFSLRNPTAVAWRGVSVHARLLDSHDMQLTEQTVVESQSLEPSAPPTKEMVSFALPSESGLYHVIVEAKDQSGVVLASNTLELGVNPLPKSILVFCAHEDDEGGYSGLTRAAIENHVPIHFVYFTSGDAGSCDRYYEHSCGPAEAVNFGRIRMDEARASLGHLGVAREAIDFLGLPDGASGMIWYDHSKPAEPFLDPLLAVDHAPYEGLVRPNLPYARDSVVQAVTELIRKLQPDVICTAHPPSVGHIDHIVNNYFVVQALQQLLREGAVSPSLTLLVDRVYDAKEQPKTPYHYQERDLYVSGEAAALAQEAWWFYESQGGNHAQGSLRSFGQLSRKESFRQVLDWNEHEGWNYKR